MSDLEDKVDRWELQELQNQVYDLESKIEELTKQINRLIAEKDKN
jgi:peptidoglycan hydrolase CwlO-like protein